MEQRGLKGFSPEIIKEALNELIRDKRYHTAPPTKKYEMLIKRCRVLEKINQKIQKAKEEKKGEH